jgi:hypothetical protein
LYIIGSHSIYKELLLLFIAKLKLMVKDIVPFLWEILLQIISSTSFTWGFFYCCSQMAANRDICILVRCFRLFSWSCGVDPLRKLRSKKKKWRANTFTYPIKMINKTLQHVFFYLPLTHDSFRNVWDVGHISILISHRPLQPAAPGLDFSIYTSNDEHATCSPSTES